MPGVKIHYGNERSHGCGPIPAPARLAGRWVAITDDNRPHYRELVTAGLMEPISTFIRGAEGHYRLTERVATEVVRDKRGQRDAGYFPIQPFSIALSDSLAAWLIGRSVSGAAIRASSWSPPCSYSASS